MKKGILVQLLLILSFCTLNAQNGAGIPIWLFTDGSSNNMILTDWRTDPPTNSQISNSGIASGSDATGVAFDKCGDVAFFVLHDGSRNGNSLFIFNKDGAPLLTNSTPNAPGLNSMSLDGEMQVVKVPNHNDEWYIIYKTWKSGAGSPNNDGNNSPWFTAFSRVKFDGVDLTVLVRDKMLTQGGFPRHYADGKAVSKTGPFPNSHYLYITARVSNTSSINVHRFIIDENDIIFDKLTGPVYAEYWSLTALASSVELSPTDNRVAIIPRQPYDFATPDIYVFNTTPFENTAGNVQAIVGEDLILQPDGVNLMTPMAVKNAANISALRFLQNFDRGLTWIEFSPNGRFLYVGEGGFSNAGFTNVTYLAQIDLNTPYPYEVRIQAEATPTGYNVINGTGCTTASCINDWNKIVSIQSAPNGDLFFRKWNSTKLFVIPNPNDLMPQQLIPGVVDLSTPTHPNIDVGFNVGTIPEQIDGFNYIDSNIVTFQVVVRKEPCAGPCVDYELILESNGDTIEIFDVQGCAAQNYLDTIIFCIDVNKDYNLSEIGGVTFTDAITNGVIHYPAPSSYFDFTDNTDDIVVNLGNDTSICYNASITLDAGPIFNQYSWNTGATSQTINVTSAGIYGLTATTADGCIATDSIVITEIPQPLPPNLGSDSIFCGSISLVLDAGDYASYLWSDGSTNQTLTINQAGNYSVTVQDSCGGSQSDAIVITDGSPSQINLGDDDTICGNVNLTLNAGSGFNTYLWNTGATTQSINITSPGNYSVTGTTINNCTSSDEITIRNITPSPPPNLGEDIVFCNANDAATLDPGTGPYLTYLWSDGSTNSTLTVNQPGNYSVTVTDSCGTVMTDAIIITDGSLSEIDLGEDTTFCGTVNLVLDAGAGFDTYLWSNNATAQTITVTQPGIYTVNVSSAAGCDASGEITITNVTPSPPPNLGEDIVFCNTNDAATLDPGTGPYLTYLWSDGSTNSTLTVNQPGNYSVTVTDSCGTVMMDAIVITDGSLSEIDLGEDTTFCGTVNLVLDAGAGFDTYLWSNNATTQTITVTQPGTYTVDVATNAGCNASGAITISTITPSPPPNLGEDIVFCNANDVATLGPGTGPYLSYLWSDGSTNSTLTVNQPGNYSVTVTDSCGTVMMDAIVITDGSLSEIDLGEDTTFCGTVNLVLDAGAGFDTYLWNNNATTQTITVTQPGTYTVDVASNAGCNASGAITISTITPSPPPNLGEDIVICGDTSIILNPGAGPYLTYEWTGGSTGSTLTVTEPGNYSVTVTDSCGTVMMDDIALTDGSVSEIDLGNDTTICGNVNLVLDAGTGFDNYVWSNNATTQTITVTQPGTYSVDVSSNTGCSASGEITISTITPSPPPNLGADTIICGGLSLTLDPGAGPYLSYEWNDGSTNPTLTVTAAGIYSVEVSDSCGNIFTDTIDITNGNTLDVTDLLPDEDLCDGAQITLDGNVTGADTWEWVSNGDVIGTSSTITINAVSDTIIILTASNICGSASDTSIINILEAPTATISGNDILCSQQDSGRIEIVFEGGNPPYSVNFGNGIENFDFNNIMNDTLVVYLNNAGTYTINSISGGTCDGTSSGSATIEISAITFDTEVNADPCLDSVGTISVSNVNGGEAPYMYSINNGPFTSSSEFTDLGAGDYTITVMDDAGCSTTTSSQITLEFAEEYTLSAFGDTTISLGNSAPIGVSINPSIVDPEISWSPEDGLSCSDCEDPIASPTETTTYTVTTTDALGCTKSENVTVEVEIVECGVYIPNAFSPNGDGQNDILYVRLNGNYVSLDFRIYNRWGELVFQTDDISIGWDGVYKGKQQNADVFGYYMELKCITDEIIQQQGNITLLR